jgi:hypothetical protein
MVNDRLGGWDVQDHAVRFIMPPKAQTFRAIYAFPVDEPDELELLPGDLIDVPIVHEGLFARQCPHVSQNRSILNCHQPPFFFFSSSLWGPHGSAVCLCRCAAPHLCVSHAKVNGGLG